MRRMFQFRLRTLFIVTIIAAAYLAGWRSAEWRMQRELKKAQARAAAEADQERALNHIDRLVLRKWKVLKLTTATVERPRVDLNLMGGALPTSEEVLRILKDQPPNDSQAGTLPLP